mgnify:CR=1 FL=1
MPFSFDFGGFDPSAFGGFSGGDASQPQRPKRERKPRKAIGNAFTRTLINLGVTLLFGLGYFYFELPALNFHAEEFYVFVFLLCAVYCVCAVLTSGFQGEGVKGYFGFVKKQCTIPFLVLVALIAAIIIGGLTSWVVIRAGSYSKLLSIKYGDFASEVEEISYNQIPMLDEAYRRAGADHPAAPCAELRHTRAGKEERAHGIHDGEVYHSRRQMPRGGTQREERRSPPVFRD